MTPRQRWKFWYRQLRIIRRESTKAHLDMLIYGTGFVEISADIPDYIRHVPTQEVIIEYASTKATT